MFKDVRITRDPFDEAAETKRMPVKAGAVVTFTGRVRAEEGLTALKLEHYPGMTQSEIHRHIAEAERRWPLLGVIIVHRVGIMHPGEPIVLVVVAAAHRREAFEACEFLMDYLKTEAPIWKEEQRGDKSEWVAAKPFDQEAAERWKPLRDRR